MNTKYWDFTVFVLCFPEPIKLESARWINKMKNLKNVAVLTRDIPVRAGALYKY